MKASEPWERAGDKIRLQGFNLELWKYEGEPGSLIPLLQAAQRDYSYIPEAAIHYISDIVGIPSAQIYGVITFFTQFRLKPLGKYLLRICNGTACHVNGSKLMGQVIEDELGIGVGQTTEDGFFTVQSVACLGCCSLSPVMVINEDTHGQLDPRKIRKILKSYQSAG